VGKKGKIARRGSRQVIGKKIFCQEKHSRGPGTSFSHARRNIPSGKKGKGEGSRIIPDPWRTLSTRSVLGTMVHRGGSCSKRLPLEGEEGKICKKKKKKKKKHKTKQKVKI